MSYVITFTVDVTWLIETSMRLANTADK